MLCLDWDTKLYPLIYSATESDSWHSSVLSCSR